MNDNKQFDFFFNRTCFRTMDGFYKDTCYNFIDSIGKKEGNGLNSKNLSRASKSEIDSIMEKYIKDVIDIDVTDSKLFAPIERKQFINSMIMFTQAHRHGKSDQLIADMKEEVQNEKLLLDDNDKERIYADFDIIRNVQYGYSQKSQQAFFGKAIETFFYIKYAQIPEGVKYLNDKVNIKYQQMPQVKKERLFKHNNDLLALACQKL